MNSKKAWGRMVAPLGVLVLAACAPNSSGFLGEQTGRGVRRLGGSGAHVMPMHPKGQSAKSFSAPQGAQLTYRGGPILDHVKVFTVFWGSGVQFQSELNSFYSYLTSSPLVDWLSEYNTKTQSFGHGSLLGSYVYTNAPGGTLDDSQIQSELQGLITAGTIPPNDGNTLYMIHFPPGVNITMGGSSSCSEFCAYHGSFAGSGNSPVFYGVMPDLGGACDGGCGGGTLLQNTTSVSSHEFTESLTDCDVGENNLAWYDDNYGEIGDICNGQQGTLGPWTIQLEYSNQAGDCIASKSGGGTGAGGGGTGAGGTGAGGGGTGSGAGGSGTGAGGSGTGAGGGGTTTGSGMGGSCGSGSSGSGGGGGCAHDKCQQGPALDGSCDGCVTLVCNYDDYCCTVAWDDICVSETGWCGASACF